MRYHFIATERTRQRNVAKESANAGSFFKRNINKDIFSKFFMCLQEYTKKIKSSNIFVKKFRDYLFTKR